MSAYRDNAYRPPPRPHVPPWWRRLWDALEEHARLAWRETVCCSLGHDARRHAGSLGLCVRCRAPLKLTRIHDGPITSRPMWVRIDVREWDRLHQLAVDMGLDKRCAERIASAGRN